MIPFPHYRSRLWNTLRSVKIHPAQHGLVVTGQHIKLRALDTSTDRNDGVQSDAKTDGNFWRVYAPLAAFRVAHCRSGDDWTSAIKPTSKPLPKLVRHVAAWSWIVDRYYCYPFIDTDKRCHGFDIEKSEP